MPGACCLGADGAMRRAKQAPPLPNVAGTGQARSCVWRGTRAQDSLYRGTQDSAGIAVRMLPTMPTCDIARDVSGEDARG